MEQPTAVMSRQPGRSPGGAGRPGTADGDAGRPGLHPLREPRGLTQGMRIRRAATLLVLTVLLPGSAQLAAGDRRIGRIALRGWLAAVATVALVGLLWAVHRPWALSLATTPLVLSLLAVALHAAALAWPLLLVDAWRLGRPAALPRRARGWIGATAFGLVLLTAVPSVALGRRAWAAGDLIGSVFDGSSSSAAVDGRYTVLLLGCDAGPDRVGTRPDSITLASIDASTGRTVLFSLPRNLENVPLPPGTPAAAALPGGWSCGDDCLLNGFYTWGAEHRTAFPGAADPGAAAMKQAVEGITGLKVNYYVLIDLKGFRQLIDAMGGVRVTVGERVAIGGGTSRVKGWIEPGTRTLNGYDALWFARSRHGADDYARMQRQRCVMDAMVRQMEPGTLLRNFQQVAAAGKQVVSTDLPAAELGTFLDLGARAKSQRITSVQFVPPLVRPAYPDYGLIRQRVAAAVAASQAAPDGPAPAAPARRAPASPGSGETPGATAPPGRGAGPDGDDVRAACSPA